jgi:hypothetical protein
MIEQTVEDLTTIIGTRPACRALGAAPATIYRRRRPPAARAARPRQPSARALSEPERAAVLAELYSGLLTFPWVGERGFIVEELGTGR